MHQFPAPEKKKQAYVLSIEEELERIMDAYGTEVLRTSYMYLKDMHMAEDAFQEVFIKIYKKYESFENRSSERTWIIRITINVCKDMLKGSWIKRVFLLERPNEKELDTGFENKIIKKDENRLLFDAVLSLPQIFKDVVILYYYQSLDTVEISKILSIAEGTVRSRLHRAREILRNNLGGRIDLSE